MLVNKKRWNPEDKIRIVLESLNTNSTIAELCRKYQITPVEFIHVHKPEQNGHIESFHKTLKKEYICTHDFASYKQAEETIRMAYHDYNHSRIHSALVYRTPEEFVKSLEMTNK